MNLALPSRRAQLVAYMPGWKSYALLYRLDPPLAGHEWILLSPIITRGWKFPSEPVVDVFVSCSSFWDHEGRLVVHEIDDCRALHDYELWGTDDPEEWLHKHDYMPVFNSAWRLSLPGVE